MSEKFIVLDSLRMNEYEILGEKIKKYTSLSHYNHLQEKDDALEDVASIVKRLFMNSTDFESFFKSVLFLETYVVAGLSIEYKNRYEIGKINKNCKEYRESNGKINKIFKAIRDKSFNVDISITNSNNKIKRGRTEGLIDVKDISYYEKQQVDELVKSLNKVHIQYINNIIDSRINHNRLSITTNAYERLRYETDESSKNLIIVERDRILSLNDKEKCINMNIEEFQQIEKVTEESFLFDNSEFIIQKRQEENEEFQKRREESQKRKEEIQKRQEERIQNNKDIQKHQEERMQLIFEERIQSNKEIQKRKEERMKLSFKERIQKRREEIHNDKEFQKFKEELQKRREEIQTSLEERIQKRREELQNDKEFQKFNEYCRSIQSEFLNNLKLQNKEYSQEEFRKFFEKKMELYDSILETNKTVSIEENGILSNPINENGELTFKDDLSCNENSMEIEELCLSGEELDIDDILFNCLKDFDDSYSY
jgi:hypothetical protein